MKSYSALKPNDIVQSKCTTFNFSSIQNSFPNQMSMPLHTIQPNHNPQGHQGHQGGHQGHQTGHQMTLQGNHQQPHQFGPALNKDKYLIQVHHPNHFEHGVTAGCSYCFMPMKTKEGIQRHAQARFIFFDFFIDIDPTIIIRNRPNQFK